MSKAEKIEGTLLAKSCTTLKECALPCAIFWGHVGIIPNFSLYFTSVLKTIECGTLWGKIKNTVAKNSDYRITGFCPVKLEVRKGVILS